jgi:Na+-transporting NADH:ubiquinone oxidoreductase subunit D
MMLAPSAFFIIALLIWAIRSLRPGQAEAPEYRIHQGYRTDAM